MQKLVLEILTEVVAETSNRMLATLQSINPAYEGVRFDYGPPAEIVGRLIQYSASDVYRYKKYPMIGIFLDFPQEQGTNAYIRSVARLHGFIAVGTSNTYTSQQRTEQTFKPLLYPIRDEFFKQLGKHPSIELPEQGVFQYTQADRYQWGKGGLEYYDNGKKDIFNDFIDAIEFTGLQLHINNYC